MPRVKMAVLHETLDEMLERELPEAFNRALMQESYRGSPAPEYERLAYLFDRAARLARQLICNYYEPEYDNRCYNCGRAEDDHDRHARVDNIRTGQQLTELDRDR